MTVTLVHSHLVQRIEHFPTYWTGCGVGAVLIFHMVGEVLNILTAVGTNAWPILILTCKVTWDIKLSIIRMEWQWNL